MENDTSKGVSDSPEQNASSDAPENQETSVSDKGDSVKYETYKKTLSEAKRFKNEVSTLREQLTSLEQKQLETEGNKDALIDSLRKQNTDLNQKLKSAVGSFAQSRVKEVLMSEATKLGCQDPDLVVQAYGQRLSEIDFDDEFNPNREQVTDILKSVKTERPFLFQKSAPAVANHNIKPDTVGKPEKPALSQLDDDKLMSAWAKAERR